MSWRVARSLDVLREEINESAPGRSTIADGSIGDAAHASRDSDHNPWVIDDDGEGVVRARDFTHDPANGVDCDVLAERIRLLGKAGDHPALGTGAYVIWEGRIASDTEDGEPWDWEPYSGSNAHRTHMHVSVALAAAGYDSTRPWGITQEDDDMAQHSDQLDTIEEKLDRLLKKASNSGERERATNELLRKIKRQGAAAAEDLKQIESLLDEG